MTEAYLSKENGLSLYDNLLDLSPDYLFHEKHPEKLPHPADILNEKINKLSKKIKPLISDQDNAKHQEKSELISSYILELDSFYDSLFLIIKCLTRPQETNNKDTIKLLKSINPEHYKRFIGATKNLHNSFRVISNKIKHDHVNISTLTIRNHNNRVVHGFYIQSSTGENDLRGPGTMIHESYFGCRTAFSYNHFLLQSIGCIFTYLDQLNKTLFKVRSKTKYDQSELLTIFNNCKIIPYDFFPDEYSRPFARIKDTMDGRTFFEYPYIYKNLRKESFENIYEVKAHLEINPRTGQSNKTIPYLPLINRRTRPMESN